MSAIDRSRKSRTRSRSKSEFDLEKAHLMSLQKAKVSKAVESVISNVEMKKKNDVLADEEENVQLQICLKKIPPANKISKINLPHPVVMENPEICLFVKDLDKKERDHEPTVEFYRELLSKKGISVITEIIPLKSLKLEYQPYEAKRNLSNAYDMFLADERILKFLPRLLGKAFYNEKKIPSQVNLRAVDLMKEIKRAIGVTRCVISKKGSSSMFTVGHTGMSKDDITDNIVAMGKQLPNCIPGGTNNIKQLLVKTQSSVSVPIYVSFGGPQDVSLPKQVEPEDDNEAEEISTVMNAKVKVFADGRVLLIKDGVSEADAMKREKLFNRGNGRTQGKRKRTEKEKLQIKRKRKN